MNIRRSINIDTAELRYAPSLDRPYAAAEYRDEIISAIEKGLNYTEIYERIKQGGYSAGYDALRRYVAQQLRYKPRRKGKNQYTGKDTCKKGHPWTEDNTYYKYSDGKITRQCRTCSAARSRRYYRNRSDS
jgi:hypothetical protein